MILRTGSKKAMIGLQTSLSITFLRLYICVYYLDDIIGKSKKVSITRKSHQFDLPNQTWVN